MVIQPSDSDYKNLINIMMTKEFVLSEGWDGSKIGWFWGGMTVQVCMCLEYAECSDDEKPKLASSVAI